MTDGMNLLFENVRTYFGLLVSISYFNTVLIFILFFFVLRFAAKFISQK